MFLRDHWYIAAMSSEIGNGPFARTLLGDPVVLYRDRAGKPVALFDQCCHRQAPLSLGEIEGDHLRCNYHGLLYDRSGACQHVPGQTLVPPGAGVRSYPVVEKWGWVWVWMGAPNAADENRLPDYHINAAEGWSPVPGYLHMKGDYRLLIDNLLDLSHLAYTHQRTIGNSHIAEDTDTKTELSEQSLRITRWVSDKYPPPLWSIHRGIAGDQKVDRWQVIDFALPSYVMIEAGGALAGEFTMDGDRSEAKVSMILNAITPETETSLHYFWSAVRNFAHDKPELDKQLYEQTYLTFVEDKDMIEGVQRNMDRTPGAPRIDTNHDAGQLHIRRVLDKAYQTQEAAMSQAAE